jgi:hypothetical protein
MTPSERLALRQRRAELERLALEYALGPQPSGDGACDAFDMECRGINKEIDAIDEQLRGSLPHTQENHE